MNQFGQYLYAPTGGGPVTPPFDTGLLLFQANPTGMVGFDLEITADAQGFLPFQIRNTSTKRILITYARFSLVSTDVRITPNSGTNNLILNTVGITTFVSSGRGFAASMGAFSSLAYTFNLSSGGGVTPEVYAGNSFRMDELAGLAFTTSTPGLDVNVTFSSLTPGQVMESWKVTPNLSVPFSGSIFRLPD